MFWEGGWRGGDKGGIIVDVLRKTLLGVVLVEKGTFPVSVFYRKG